MNYYEHHIGDYTVSTMHLTLVEDAAYSRLLRHYYATEKPLPADVTLLQKIVRATSKKEKDAVIAVLHEFFTLTEEGWRQARCDAEIARYQAKQEKARQSAKARWHGAQIVNLPPETPLKTGVENGCERIANAMRTQCSPDTKHHTPDSIHQSPINQYDVGKNDRGGSHREFAPNSSDPSGRGDRERELVAETAPVAEVLAEVALVAPPGLSAAQRFFHDWAEKNKTRSARLSGDRVRGVGVDRGSGLEDGHIQPLAKLAASQAAGLRERQINLKPCSHDRSGNVSRSPLATGCPSTRHLHRQSLPQPLPLAQYPMYCRP